MMFGFSMRSSAVSSMTTMRSWSGIDWPRMFKQRGLSGPGSAADKDGLAALDLGGQELRKRARKRSASDQVFDREMAAGELADDHRGSGPDDRGNHRCQAAPIGKLRIEQRVVFVELLAEPVGNHFETGAQPSRVELNARVAARECRRARTTMSSRDCP